MSTDIAAQMPPHDAAGHVEVRGIEPIPHDERHGHPRELFSVWLASNTAYLYLLLGGTLMVLGLRVWQAVLVVVVGNLAWLGVGILAVSGPAAGTPGVVITRAFYGVRANRFVSAGLTWFTSVCFEAINLSIAALAAFAFVAALGATTPLGLKIVLLVAVGVATFAISVLGHATIVRVSHVFTVLLGLCVLALAGFVIAHAHFGYQPHPALHGGMALATMFVGLTVIASGPLSWATSADYSRYLPREVRSTHVAIWTAAGGFIPSVGLGLLGVLAGTAVNMSDPQSSMRVLMPGWFYDVFLLVVIGGSITNNVLTSYSSGLALQAAGVRARRARTVLVDAAIGGGMTAYALFISNFLTTLNEFLQLSIVWLGPGLAIYVADIVLRRNRYDGRALFSAQRNGPHWHHGGVNLAGVTALVLGAGAAFLCANTTHWEGPVARALDGADLSALVGPIVGAAIYLLLWRRAARPVRDVRVSRESPEHISDVTVGVSR